MRYSCAPLRGNPNLCSKTISAFLSLRDDDHFCAHLSVHLSDYAMKTGSETRSNSMSGRQCERCVCVIKSIKCNLIRVIILVCIGINCFLHVIDDDNDLRAHSLSKCCNKISEHPSTSSQFERNAHYFNNKQINMAPEHIAQRSFNENKLFSNFAATLHVAHSHTHTYDALLKC